MLAPRLGTADDTKVVLSFDSGVTDLGNIDYHAFVSGVIHKIQAESDLLTQRANYVDMNSEVFKWLTLTGKRDPRKRKKAIPDIESKDQNFETVGLSLSGYDDDAYLVDYVIKNATIQVTPAIHHAMMLGFRRLMSRLILSAMIQPKVARDTNTNSVWKNPSSSRVETPLPDSRIGGRITLDSSSHVQLAKPNNMTFQKIHRKFRDLNVAIGTKLCGLLTPGMEELIFNLDEYGNRDHNSSLARDMIYDPSVKSFQWLGIEWIKIEPDIAPGGSNFNDKFFEQASGANDLGEIKTKNSGATNDVDLGDGTSNSTKYELVPIWNPANIYWGSNASLGMNEIYRVPTKRQTPVLSMSEWLGATRVQDELVYILVIPA